MPLPLGPDEELRRLKEFVDHLRAVLQSVVNQPGSIVPGRHHELMRMAWFEIGPQFAALAGAFSPDNRSSLERVGLVGYPLRFELDVFDHARDQLLDHAPEVFGSEPPASHPNTPGWKRPVRWLLKKCLRSGDVILGSLASLFPPAEVIKQFKEGVECAIDFAGDDESP
jgi:hypothetical protein